MMACKIAEIEEVTTSWISWFNDIHMIAVSPNMSSDSPDFVPFKSLLDLGSQFLILYV